MLIHLLERELALHHLLDVDLLGERFLSTFDQRLDVTHAKKLRDEPVGLELLQVVETLANTDECDRRLRLRDCRERTAPFCCAIELCYDYAGYSNRFMKRTRLVSCLLPDRCIQHKQSLIRLCDRVDPLHLLDQIALKRMPPRGVDNLHIVRLQFIESPLRNSDGIIGAFPIECNVQTVARHLQLIIRTRTIGVRTDHSGFHPFPLEVSCQFRRGRGLSAALKPDHHNRLFREHLRRILADEVHELVIHDPDHVFPCSCTRGWFLVQRPLTYPLR